MLLRRATTNVFHAEAQKLKPWRISHPLNCPRILGRQSPILHERGYSSPPQAGIQKPDDYCRDLVKKYDRDWYLINMLCPKPFQNAFFAARAFYIELATIQDSVSNVMIAQMRMQFWKDAVKNISERRPPHHPIALALYEASKTVHISSYHLNRIIDARNDELTTSSHMTMDTLISHAESISSTLNYLLLSIVNLSSSDTFAHAASHLGVSQTLVTLLRALPYHASKGRMIIPTTLTARHHVNQEEVFRRGPEAQGLEDAVFDFAVEANNHLMAARELFKKNGESRVAVPREAMPVFLGAVPVSHYLARLETAQFNVFDPKLQIRDSLRLTWLIWLKHWKNEF